MHISERDHGSLEATPMFNYLCRTGESPPARVTLELVRREVVDDIIGLRWSSDVRWGLTIRHYEISGELGAEI